MQTLRILPDGKKFCRLHFQSVWLFGFCRAEVSVLRLLFCSLTVAGVGAGKPRGLFREEGGNTVVYPAESRSDRYLCHPGGQRSSRQCVNQVQAEAGSCLSHTSPPGPRACTQSTFAVAFLFTWASFLLSIPQYSFMWGHTKPENTRAESEIKSVSGGWGPVVENLSACVRPSGQSLAPLKTRHPTWVSVHLNGKAYFLTGRHYWEHSAGKSKLAHLIRTRFTHSDIVL